VNKLEMDVVINPDQLTIMMLYSLLPSFENFRIAIESRDELPEPEALRTKIVEESDARSNATTSNQLQNALLVNKRKKCRQKKDSVNKEERDSKKEIQRERRRSNTSSSSVMEWDTKLQNVRPKRQKIRNPLACLFFQSKEGSKRVRSRMAIETCGVWIADAHHTSARHQVIHRDK